MWPFRRRKVGRHALGAAVTSIPSARTVPAVPVPSVPPAPPAAVAPPAPEPVVEPVVEPALVPQVLIPEPPPAQRVELGFRDGSTAALAPGSEQARALTDIASILTRRD